MKHDDEAARARADWTQILLLCVETERVLHEAPGALRRLRIHCLREKSQVLLQMIPQPQEAEVLA